MHRNPALTIRSHLLVVTVFLTLSLLPSCESMLLRVGNFLIVDEPSLRSADLIHVLGGGADRIPYGIQLYRQGYGQKIFFTGGGSVQTDTAEYRTVIEYAEDVARAQGVDLAGLIADSSSAASTYDEAIELKQVLESHPDIRSVIIVSEPYHLRRVRWTFEKVIGDRADLQYAAVPFSSTHYQSRWWDDESSAEFVRDEYLKLLYYWLRY